MDESAYRLQHEPVDITASRLPAPVLTYLPEREVWRLEEDYMYVDGPTRLTVAAGFEFDLASVPRAFWWLISPFELSVTAPLMHDWLYAYGGRPPPGAAEPPRTYTRKEADQLFRRIMEQEGVPAWRRTLAYYAVRLFGGSGWKV